MTYFGQLLFSWNIFQVIFISYVAVLLVEQEALCTLIAVFRMSFFQILGVKFQCKLMSYLYFRSAMYYSYVIIPTSQ